MDSNNSTYFRRQSVSPRLLWAPTTRHIFVQTISFALPSLGLIEPTNFRRQSVMNLNKCLICRGPTFFACKYLWERNEMTILTPCSHTDRLSPRDKFLSMRALSYLYLNGKESNIYFVKVETLGISLGLKIAIMCYALLYHMFFWKRIECDDKKVWIMSSVHLWNDYELAFMHFYIFF